MKKKCYKCGRIKSIKNFCKDKTRIDGFSNKCKSCVKEYHKEYITTEKNKKRAFEYKRKWRAKNKNRILKERKLERINNPEKEIARGVLNREIRSRRMDRPDYCSKCGVENDIEAHHTDYSKPLDVIWLCVPCHKKEHLNLKKVG